MFVGEFCTRNVMTIMPDATVQEAAARMREHHVGDLVVVAGDESRPVPLGILTDRDLVVGALAQVAVDVAKLVVEDLLTSELRTAHERDYVSEVIVQMRREGVRRMPIVDDEGRLVGIFTADDVIDLLSRQLAALAELVRSQPRREVQVRP